MKLATRVALVAALCLFGCKKEPKDGAAKTAESDKPAKPATDDTNDQQKPPVTPSPEAAAAVKGFAAIAKTSDAGRVAAGAGGGLGSALGGIFGGGATAQSAPAPTSRDQPAPPDGEAVLEDNDDEGGNVPPPANADPFAGIPFPPAGAKGGDCGAVTDRVMAIVLGLVEKELGAIDAEQRKLVQGTIDQEMGKVKDQLRTMCEDQKWPQELRDCILVATSGSELTGCEKLMQASAPAPEPVAAPAHTGGHECSDVGARMRVLTEAQMGEIPAESKAEIDTMLDEQVKEITEACTSQQWPEAWRSCVTGAATVDAAGACFE